MIFSLSLRTLLTQSGGKAVHKRETTVHKRESNGIKLPRKTALPKMNKDDPELWAAFFPHQLTLSESEKKLNVGNDYIQKHTTTGQKYKTVGQTKTNKHLV